jgi:hypothetical protein
MRCIESPLKKLSNTTRLLVKMKKIEQSVVLIVEGNSAKVYSFRVGLESRA